MFKSTLSAPLKKHFHFKSHFHSSVRNLSSLDQFNVFSQSNQPKLPLIQKCKKDGFIAGNVHLKGGITLINGGIFLWDIEHVKDLTLNHFSIFKFLLPLPVVVGTGKEMQPLKPEILKFFQSLGMQVEVANSRSACTTYNVLVEEERQVAACLLPQTPISARSVNLPPDEY